VPKRKRRLRADETPLAKCFGRWRVDAGPVLHVLRSAWPGAVERVRSELKSLEEELNTDRERIRRLLREAVVAETPLGPIRRYRVSTPAGWLRLLFFVDAKNCLVVFTDVQLRDEETYRRVRRRWGR